MTADEQSKNPTRSRAHVTLGTPLRVLRRSGSPAAELESVEVVAFDGRMRDKQPSSDEFAAFDASAVYAATQPTHARPLPRVTEVLVRWSAIEGMVEIAEEEQSC